MKVLLINPPDDLAAFLGEGKNLVHPYEPLGLLYVAAVAREAGFSVTVLDANAEGLDLEQTLTNILAQQPDVVGFTTFTSNGGIVYHLGKRLKQALPSAWVVFGNVHAGVYAEQYLKCQCCDFVIHGEGEWSFLALLKALQQEKPDFSAIPNLSYLQNGTHVSTSTFGFVDRLDEIPMPARDLVKRELYKTPLFNNLAADGKVIAKHMFTSRGCPFRCTFCVVHHGAKPRYNGVTQVVDEMEMLIREYQANYIFFMDSLFISNKQRVMAICDEIRRRNIQVRWGCEGHVRFIDEELVRAMDLAGCHDMAFGIESGVQRLLDNIRKGIKLERVEEAIRIVRACSDIQLSGLFILGLPGETEEDTLQTIAFAKRLPLDTAQFSLLVPYPGSPLFRELAQKGELDTAIRENDTLAPEVWMRYCGYISYTDRQPIWVTPSMTGPQLKRLQKRAVREFYFRPRQFWHQAKRLRLSQLPVIIRTFLKTFF
ncbi:MAG: cobalamin-dependent protein [Magnetococcales bacterium]|nr:cobalamin-dependent protein [Magnetococcales bacterium]